MTRHIPSADVLQSTEMSDCINHIVVMHDMRILGRGQPEGFNVRCASQTVPHVGAPGRSVYRLSDDLRLRML